MFKRNDNNRNHNHDEYAFSRRNNWISDRKHFDDDYYQIIETISADYFINYTFGNTITVSYQIKWFLPNFIL